MPFIETALIGDNSDENINHYGAVRLRVTGSGELDMKLMGFNRVKSKDFKALNIDNISDIEPTRLINFSSQRALLRIETDKINEIMDINRIVIFVKPLYTQGTK